MSLTEKEIKLVTDSWSKVVPISEVAADLFYNKLFEIQPSVEDLFKSDIKVQGKKLMKMIGTLVIGLTEIEKLVPAIKDLAMRHVDYGVEKDHYSYVGEALLWTLGEGLKEDFTQEVRDAWTKVYTIVSGVMIDTAHPNEDNEEIETVVVNKKPSIFKRLSNRIFGK